MTDSEEDIVISNRVEKNWQHILHMLRELTEVSAAFIARIKEHDELKILNLDRSDRIKEITPENSDIIQLIKEAKDRKKLTEKRITAGENQVLLAGIPIFYPEKDRIFATLTVVDKTSRSFADRDKNLLIESKKLIENQLESGEQADDGGKIGEDYYKVMFERAPIGIMLEDGEGNILKVNDALCDISGYSREELEGSSVFDKLVLTDQIEEAKKNIERILAGEELQFDIKSITKDGQEIYTHITETAITLPGGDPGIISMHSDITKRKRLEEKLKLTQFSMENAAVGIFWITPGGKFEYVNKQACEMLGYTQEELTGKEFQILIPIEPERKEKSAGKK